MSATAPDQSSRGPAVGFPPPDVAITVIGEADLASAVNRKVATWLRAGVRLVWVVDPFSRCVHCYDRDRPSVLSVWHEADTLRGDPVLPGLALPVADLFRLPTGAATGQA